MKRHTTDGLPYETGTNFESAFSSNGEQIGWFVKPGQVKVNIIVTNDEHLCEPLTKAFGDTHKILWSPNAKQVIEVIQV